MTRLLLAGATGYLGSHILQELPEKDIQARILIRDRHKLPSAITDKPGFELWNAELTQPEQLTDCCKDMDVIISTVGITRQKEGFSYMDVDYQANLNLLEEAKRSGVKKFIYISIFDGQQLKQLKICEAKEKFADALKASGLDYCIVRPTGYFSDMGEFYKMAEKGKVYLFKNGLCQMNPIHGADLAKICLQAIHANEKEIAVGGPQVFNYQQIAALAFAVAGKTPNVSYVPEWLRTSALFLLRTFTGGKTYGPIEFFMTVLSRNMIAPAIGEHRLEDYFRELKK